MGSVRLLRGRRTVADNRQRFLSAVPSRVCRMFRAQERALLRWDGPRPQNVGEPANPLQHALVWGARRRRVLNPSCGVEFKPSATANRPKCRRERPCAQQAHPRPASAVRIRLAALVTPVMGRRRASLSASKRAPRLRPGRDPPRGGHLGHRAIDPSCGWLQVSCPGLRCGWRRRCTARVRFGISVVSETNLTVPG